MSLPQALRGSPARVSGLGFGPPAPRGSQLLGPLGALAHEPRRVQTRGRGLLDGQAGRGRRGEEVAGEVESGGFPFRFFFLLFPFFFVFSGGEDIPRCASSGRASFLVDSFRFAFFFGGGGHPQMRIKWAGFVFS